MIQEDVRWIEDSGRVAVHDAEVGGQDQQAHWSLILSSQGFSYVYSWEVVVQVTLRGCPWDMLMFLNKYMSHIGYIDIDVCERAWNK